MRITIPGMNLLFWSRLNLEKAVGFLTNSHAIIAAEGTSFLTGWYYSMSDSSLLSFSPMVACRVPFGTMKASHLGGSFQAASRLISMPDNQCVRCLQQQGLIIKWWWAVMSLDKACIVLWASGASLTNNPQGDIPHLTLMLSFINARLLGTALLLR